MALQVALQQFLGGVLDDVPADLNPRLIRDRQLFRAGAPQHRSALAVGEVGGVARQAGLADPRLARNEHEATVPPARFASELAEVLALRNAPDEARRGQLLQARRQRNRGAVIATSRGTRTGARGRAQRLVVAKDRRLELSQLGPRLQADLI